MLVAPVPCHRDWACWSQRPVEPPSSTGSRREDHLGQGTERAGNWAWALSISGSPRGSRGRTHRWQVRVWPQWMDVRMRVSIHKTHPTLPHRCLAHMRVRMAPVCIYTAFSGGDICRRVRASRIISIDVTGLGLMLRTSHAQ